MSASREKRSRQDVSEEVLSERSLKRQQEEKAERRSMMTYTIVGVITAILAIVVVVWNNGVIQRSLTAVEINGTKYTAAAVQYHLSNVLSRYGMNSSSDSLKSTVMDETTGQTMYDFFLDQAIDNMVTTTALADQIKTEGYTMSQSAQDSIDSTLENLDSSWASLGYASRDVFLRANFGPYMTYNQLVELLTQDVLVHDYQTNAINALEYSDSEYETYYEENADSLDTYTLTQFVFQAKVSTTDAEGNPIEMTDEEKSAALEEAKAEQKALAEELMAKLEAGEDAEALAEEYADKLYSSAVSQSRIGSNVNSSYSEWTFDSARKNGDLTLAEYDSTSAYNYYVVRFEDRRRDETRTNNVRHILLKAETDEGAAEPSEEQYAEAKTRAEEVLALWEAGEQTEDAFAALAAEYSEDSGTASDGGMISNITEESSYVEPFKNWAIDPARKDGDVDLVQTTYGWHIMYYTSGDPTWKQAADSALRNADYSEWVEAAREGYDYTTGLGLKFVQG